MSFILHTELYSPPSHTVTRHIIKRNNLNWLKRKRKNQSTKNGGRFFLFLLLSCTFSEKCFRTLFPFLFRTHNHFFSFIWSLLVNELGQSSPLIQNVIDHNLNWFPQSFGEGKNFLRTIKRIKINFEDRDQSPRYTSNKCWLTAR
jgi:hypothetical protein